jgi:hypothetical protein
MERISINLKLNEGQVKEAANGVGEQSEKVVDKKDVPING